MRIRNSDGVITIYCLPDNAKCRVSGKSPEYMIKCPIYNFDDYGDECVPELCDEYEEGDGR